MFYSIYLYLKHVLRISVIMALSVITVRMLLIDIGRVNGKSMEHTYLDQSVFLVDRVSLLLHAPRRGDVVQLFDHRSAEKKLVIKRIIGLPGERVKISKNNVYIISPSGEETQLDEPYLDTGTITQTVSHATVTYATIPTDTYFILGDHRDESIDSRYYGVVHRSYITGRLIPLPTI